MSRAPRKTREASEPASPAPGRRSLVAVDLGQVQELLTPATVAGLQAETARLGTKLEELRRSLSAIDLPFQTRDSDLTQWKELADELRANSDTILILAAGGAHLAGRAVAEAFSSLDGRKLVHFVGDHLNPERYGELVTSLEQSSRRLSLVAISQGPPPLEVTVGWKLLHSLVAERHGCAEAQRRVVVVADSEAEGLLALSQSGNHRRLAIPDRVGSQFLALTCAALFPIALAGLDIGQLVEGARSQARSLDKHVADDPCIQFCLARQNLLTEHQLGELLVTEDPQWAWFGAWWRHLMGLSSAKMGVGAPFPATACVLSDLYALTSVYQNSRPHLFEVAVRAAGYRLDPPLPEGPLSDVYRDARNALTEARSQFVPSVTLTIDRQDLFSFGALMEFFIIVAGLSQKLLGLPGWNDVAAGLYNLDQVAG